MSPKAPKIAALLILGGGAAAFWLWPRASTDAAAFSSSVVEATELDLGARVGGRLLTLSAREGDAVEEGAALATLDCRPLESVREELVAQLERARAEARAASAAVRGVGAQRSGRTTQVRAAHARTRALAARKEAAERSAQRVTQVGRFATEAQRDESQVAAQELSLQLQAAERDAASLRAQVRATGAEEEAAEARAEAASHGVAALESKLRAVELDLAECTIRAPRAGVVETVFVERGELVRPGQPVLRILDRADLEATLYVGADALSAVSAGAEVSVRADPFGDERFAGRVTTVAVEAVYTPRNIQTRSDRERLVYPVVVTLDDPSGRLLPGMPLEIWMERP